MDATPSLKMLRSRQRSWIYSCGWLNFPDPVVVADGKEVEDRSNFAILKNHAVKSAKSPAANLAYMNIHPHMSIEPGPKVPDAF